MKRGILFVAFTLCCTVATFSQTGMQYFISLNGNLYLPFNSEKQTYPIVGYDKDQDPKVLVGGFGIGFSVLKELKGNWLLKGQTNISRHAYWDDPINFTDANNVPLGAYVGKSVDYGIGSAAIIQYRLGKKVAVGTGLGADILLKSVYHISNVFVMEENLPNEHYKTITPVLPVELSFYLNKVLLNIRYEQGLTSRYREAFVDYDKELNGLLVFEFGYRLN